MTIEFDDCAYSFEDLIPFSHQAGTHLGSGFNVILSVAFVFSLLTFCPPGPDERENSTTQDVRGIESAVRSSRYLSAAGVDSCVNGSGRTGAMGGSERAMEEVWNVRAPAGVSELADEDEDDANALGLTSAAHYEITCSGCSL